VKKNSAIQTTVNLTIIMYINIDRK